MLHGMVHMIIGATQSLCPTASACNFPDVAFDATALGKIFTLAYRLVAALSILFLVIGATKYTLSGGDSAGLKSAKNTIVYAVAGLIVSLVAFIAVATLSGKIGGL